MALIKFILLFATLALFLYYSFFSSNSQTISEALRPHLLYLDISGVTRKIDRFGKPSTATTKPMECANHHCVVGIHGMTFDAYDDFDRNPNHTMFKNWAAFLGHSDKYSFIGLSWPSVSTTTKNLLSSWLDGNATWYGQSKFNAQYLSSKLYDLLSNSDNRYTFICHSVGCYFLLSAMKHSEIPNIDKIVLLNAAIFEEDSTVNLDLFRPYETYNIYVEDDGILNVAKILEGYPIKTCIGLSGLDETSFPHNRNIKLVPKQFGSTFSTAKSNPNRYFNHVYSYDEEASMKLIVDLL